MDAARMIQIWEARIDIALCYASVALKWVFIIGVLLVSGLAVRRFSHGYRK